jgi:hypothetical protein
MSPQAAQSWIDISRMERIDAPFQAYRISNVLPQEHYLSLVREYDFFRSHFRWSRLEDCSMDTFFMREKNSLLLKTFSSAKEIKAVEAITQLPLLPFTETGLHYHPPGQPDGTIHQDYVYVDFVGGDAQRTPTVNFSPRSSYARAFALIYYFHNDWAGEQSRGGTGLYAPGESYSEDSFSRVGYVPPVNNSALLFECSPNGWHGFVENPEGERVSMITWYLSTAEAMEKKYGISPFHNVSCIRETLEYYRRLKGS